MGGNGFYWVTSIDPERPHIIEVRRWGGTQAWRSEPGEFYHSSTGELGGLWRNRRQGAAEARGVGVTSEGFDHNVPYRRLPDSQAPEASFIFEGIGPDESIGDFDCLIPRPWGGRVQGRPLRRTSRDASSCLAPRHRVPGFTDAYQFVVEEVDASDSRQGGRSTPSCERIWSTSRVRTAGGILHRLHRLVRLPILQRIRRRHFFKRITENVLRKFASSASN